tara:strand:- start:1416 stop:1646 length:231 start_codon:yes stop_codon:yes gene_type:complete
MKLKYNIGDMLIELVDGHHYSGNLHSGSRQTIVLDIDNKNGKFGSDDWCYKVLNVKTGKIYRQHAVYIETFCKKVG